MDNLWSDVLFSIFGYDITIKRLIDLSLVAYLLYRVYKLAKGTAAIKIFFGLTAIYIIYFLVDLLDLKYTSQLLGGFVGVGFIIIVVLFQQEIRRYLSLLGKRQNIKSKYLLKIFNSANSEKLDITPIIKSCISFSRSKTGAIIVLAQRNTLNNIIESAVDINSNISFPLIESIFYKNSPLHDGAIIIQNNKIIAARCILPITNDDSFPGELGMRHRAAVGMSENSDAITIVVSEQNGDISYSYEGKIYRNIDIKEIEKFLMTQFNQE